MESLKFDYLEPSSSPPEEFAFHVFTPALMHRIQHGLKCNLPCMALRSSLDNFETMVLYHQIDVLGESSLRPLFAKPLPGTNNRGVCIMFTKATLRVWYPSNKPLVQISTANTRKPEDIMNEVMSLYERG